MQPNWDDPEDLPLRFVPPDGWRRPDPQWVSLHQGFQPPEAWQPYPECPPAPPNWPFWEENGASWYTFFRFHTPPPTRGVGWWFSLAAAGLFTTAVSPFALGFPEFLIAFGLALVAVVVGVVGVVRSLRRQSHWLSGDPIDRVRTWAEQRRAEWLQRAYDTHRATSDNEPCLSEFEASMNAWWWRERLSAEESL